MSWLIERLMAAWQSLRQVPYRPSRVGVLNTGELVLVDGLGQSTIFSTETTGLMRDALVDTDPDVCELLIGVPGAHREPMTSGLQTCGAGCTD